MTRARDVANIDGILTTTGDTFYASAAGTPARLGIGSTSQVLTVASGVPSWATPSGSAFSGIKIYNSTDISISNGTWTSVTFNSEYFDTDAFHSTSSNTSRITIPTGKAGKYLLTLTGNYTNGANGDRRIALAKNGTRVMYLIFTPSAVNYTSMVYTTTFSAAEADYFELQTYQSSGGALNFTGGSDQNDFTATFLGA